MNPEFRTLWLKITLESDAAFGRGDGLAGLVDSEVQHDDYGLPFLGGKTLKGLLGAECAEVLHALRQCGCKAMEEWMKAARFLFGNPGSLAKDQSMMRVGDAQLPEALRSAIREEFRAFSYVSDKDREREWGLKRMANLKSLTTLRRQTAMDPKTGAPLRNALRTIRMIVRSTPLVARLDFDTTPDQRARQLLAACLKAFRRAGTGRSRGHGRLTAELYDGCLHEGNSGRAAESIIPSWFDEFVKEVRSECSQVPDSTG